MNLFQLGRARSTHADSVEAQKRSDSFLIQYLPVGK